jgi:nicotinate-nucleotide adenylyltransferase
MRIGIFGGTFNPVHFGHLRSALEVKEGFELDEVILIPAALPPHKLAGEVAEAADRLLMLRLALEDSAGLELSDVELKRSGPSYTIDTVHHFKRTLPAESRIFLIMGLDAFLEIDTWKSYEELLRQVPFIIINRPKAGIGANGFRWKALEDYLKAKISADYVFAESQSGFCSPDKQPVYVFEVTALDISSTAVRRLVKEGRSIGYLMPQKVAEFIKSKGIYL